MRPEQRDRGGSWRSRSAPPRLVLLIAIAAGAAAVAVAHRWHTNFGLVRLFEGLSFIAAGLVAWRFRPDSRTGKLMVVGGFLHWVPTEYDQISPLLFTITNPFQSMGPAFILYMLITFPRGRLGSRAERGVFSLLVFTILWLHALWMPFYDPRAYGCQKCPENMNLLQIRSMPDLIHATNRVKPVLIGASLLSIAALLVVRWLRATPLGRRALGPMLLPAAGLLVANTTSSVIGVLVLGVEFNWAPPPLLYTILQHTVTAAVFLLPLAFLLGLVRSRARHVNVSRLVVELGDLPAPDKLEEALARALGDSSLMVGIWDPKANRYFRMSGDALEPPVEDSPFVATRLERRGQPLALMVHDRTLLDEPGLVEATAAAARLAVENERLQAEIRAQLEEVHASRQRIVSAQDQERRRIERDLHDGAQQRLLRLSMALQVAESSLPETSDPALRTSLEVAAEELQLALRELRELARGIHPAVLTQRGLGAALRSLAETAAVPVVIEKAPEVRLPAAVEAVGYFVVSEALANAAKHAQAARVTVSARLQGDTLAITVADDGAGGAVLERGSGLRGLADRVQALDGTLSVESVQGQGTKIVATIPLVAAAEVDAAAAALEHDGT